MCIRDSRYTEMEVKQNGKTEKVNVGGGWGQSFGSMLYLKGNESLGMPDSEASKKPRDVYKRQVGTLGLQNIVRYVEKKKIQE